MGLSINRTKAIMSTIKEPGYRRFPVPIRQNPLAIHIVQSALRMIDEIRELEE